MAKINESFPMDMFKFIHKPLRNADKTVDNFIERFLTGEQFVWESLNEKILGIQDLNNPEKIRADLLQYLKDIVGLTRDLRNITDSLTEDDLRKVILLAIPLWKTKGMEIGFKNSIRLFTGFNARVFNWFDYRMIIGEKALGEEQLGEDSWLISRPNVFGSTPLGDATLLLQFEDQTIRDRSIFQNVIIPYGSPEFVIGGPFSSSKFHIKGTNIFLQVPFNDIYDFTKSFTFECFIKCWDNRTFPLVYFWDDVYGRGIKLILDTTNDELTYVVSDGVTTQTNTVSTIVDMSNNIFRHVAWVYDYENNLVSIWVNGTQVLSTAVNNAILGQFIANNEDLFIGSEGVLGNKFAIDAIRMTSDARYNVLSATITPPATNFIEYQEEQLDEFQIDIRIVDDGTLDRTMLKRILNLMRGSSERLNLLFIDFFEDFESGKGQLVTITGTAYIEKVVGEYILKVPENSLEHVDTAVSSTWTDYTAQIRAVIYDGKEFEFRFLIQDDLNYYAFRVNSLTKLAYIEKAVGGVRTTLATPKVVDVVTAVPPNYIPYYVFLVSVFKNINTGVTTLRTFVDSNLIFKVDDTEYDTGTFGIYVPAGSTVWCSDIEMFQMPLESDRIEPNSEF